MGIEGLPHILMYGNPADGFRFVGPFDDGTEAIEYAESDPEHSLAGRDWWVIPLDAPAGKRR